MTKIDIKPLTVNQAWKGRRAKTTLYKQYQTLLTLMLPKKLDIPDGKLKIKIEFGLSSKLSDWDNPIKQFQDILCKKYGINDSRIYKGIVEKVDVEKGKEYIKFKIESYERNII